jgi:hypothetical protein
MQITVPSDALWALYVSSPIAEVTVGPGFAVRDFAAVASFSSGNINVVDMTVDTLHVWTTGYGALFPHFGTHHLESPVLRRAHPCTASRATSM